MHDPQVAGAGPLFDRRGVIVAALAVLVLFTSVGFVVGEDVTQRRHDLGGWHTGTAVVGQRVVTIEYDDWSYGASESVESWIDRAGTWHDEGWPDCLRLPTTTKDVPVTFAAHEVNIDGMTWRPIIAIDCRASGTQPG